MGGACSCSRHCSPALVCIHSCPHPLTFAAVARIRWGGTAVMVAPLFVCSFPFICACSVVCLFSLRVASVHTRLCSLAPLIRACSFLIWPSSMPAHLCACPHSFVPALAFALLFLSSFGLCSHSFVFVPVFVWPSLGLVCAPWPLIYAYIKYTIS